MLREKEPPSIVKGVMTKPVITIDKDSSVFQAAKVMSEKAIGSIVVTDKGEPVGITTERDILQRVVAKGLDASNVQMNDVMSQPLITVNESVPIINAIRIMERNRVRHLLIIEKDELAGIVTQRDLLRVLVFHVLISFRPLL
ncbi:MAG: CBS domain-containing protein [Candidatus Bathyarchaeota archaeon]|nr:CBS domain-containing protein [Candidatus Bathyarchaeota archaeon]MDH5786954.1 CBS domain-containing protein [Candidatus Bathyarchaeota archaeon]